MVPATLLSHADEGIKHQDDCQSLLLKMRDDGAVKFDIHKGHWLAA